MVRKTVAATLALLAVSLSGCGTFNDAICGPLHSVPFYSGVQFDVEMAIRGGDGLPRPLEWFALADIPLSAVADTVLVPVIGGGLLVALVRKAIDPEFEIWPNLTIPLTIPPREADAKDDSEPPNTDELSLKQDAVTPDGTVNRSLPDR
jgi:uncharacterized protein YceK